MAAGHRGSTQPFADALRTRAATTGRGSAAKARRAEKCRGNEAVAYYRVSTIKQVTEGMSLPEQQRQVMREVSRLGLTLAMEFRDEGLSGRRLDRAGFMAMIEFAETHMSIGHLVCMNPSRLGRNNWLAEFLIELSLTTGLKIHFVDCAFDLSTAAGRRDFRSANVEAAFYAENASEESTRRGEQARREGQPTCRPPNGYDPVRRSVSGPYTFKPNEIAGFITRSFELMASGGMSATEALARLTEEGLRTGAGKPYTLQSFTSMLQNRAYTGLIKISGTEWGEGNYPAIVPDDLFEAVQARLDGRAPGTYATRSASLALMGFARCAFCGGSVTGYPMSKNGNTYHYYKCARDSHHLHASASVVEGCFAGVLRHYGLNRDEIPRLRSILDEEVGEEMNRRRLEVRRCRDRLSALRGAMESLKDALGRGRLAPEDYNEMKARNAEERADLEEALRQAESELRTFSDDMDAIFDPALGLGEGWRSTALDSRRMLQAACFPGGVEIARGADGSVSIAPLPPGPTVFLKER